MFSSAAKIMLHFSRRSHTPAKSKGSKRYPPQASTRKGDRSFGASNSPKLRHQSYETQNLPYRIGPFNTFQSPLHGQLDRDSCLSFDSLCSKGLICSPWDCRLPKNGSRINRDMEAAKRVEMLILRRRKSRLTNRIFRNLVTRQDQLDDDSLDDLLYAADKIVFGGSLSGRVCWEWSNGQPEYEHEMLGTTAFRPTESSVGGFGTLIVLSTPLLKDKRFTRDLLLSTFLHELIHSYLFIACGLDHAKGDGHTEGFQKIAQLIDKHFGHERLHLCNMQANLNYFLASTSKTLGGNYPPGQESSGLESLPQDKPPCDNPVDEGYWSRDSSPGFIRSPHPPDYYVINQVRSDT